MISQVENRHHETGSLFRYPRSRSWAKNSPAHFPRSVLLTLLVILSFLGRQASQAGTPQEPLAFFAGPGILHDALALPDGSVLIAGETDHLNWLPSGTSVVEWSPRSSNGWEFPVSASPRRGILLHVEPDFSRIRTVFVTPTGKGGPIHAIKSDAVPGSGAGRVYLAGQPTPETYWLLKLEPGFDSKPGPVTTWGYDAQTKNGQKLPLRTIWDVGGDGRIVFLDCKNKDWAVAARLRADGSGLCSVPEWKKSHENKQPDGSEAKVLALKTGTGDLRSETKEEFERFMPDGNGNMRKGSMPHDAFFAEAKSSGNRSRGYTGYTVRNNVGTTFAVAVDKRTNAFFLGGNVQSILPPWNDLPNAPDFEPWVMAFEEDGRMRWWSRLYSEILGHGGQFTSSDRGAMWQAHPAGMLIGSPESVFTTAGKIFLIERGVGIKVSEKNGPWREIACDIPHQPPSALASPDGNILLVGGPKGNVSRSDDGGVTWKPSEGNLPVGKNQVLDIRFQTGRPERVLLLMKKEGLFISDDMGLTWRRPVLSPTQAPHTIYESPAKPGTFYVISDDALQISSDGGENWQAINVSAPDRKFTSLAVDPLNPETLYLASVGKGEGMRVSLDGGATWTEEKVGNTKISSVSCVPSPNGTSVFATSWDRKIFLREPSGKNAWTSLREAQGLEKAPGTFCAVMPDPMAPGTILAFTAGAGILSTPDQYVDELAVDYSKPVAEGELVVLARAHGNNVSNLWNGIPGKSFMPRQTGTRGNEHYHWIGRLKESDGAFVNATWFTGHDPFGGSFGKPFENPNLNGWPNPVSGNANLKGAKGRSLRLSPSGQVALAGTTRASITTATAFQQMTNPLVGKAPWHNFFRIHAPDLSTVEYATAFTGTVWNPETGEGDNATQINGLGWLLGNAIVAVGKHNGSGSLPPLANIPKWGASSPTGETMLVGVFPIGASSRSLETATPPKPTP